MRERARVWRDPEMVHMGHGERCDGCSCSVVAGLKLMVMLDGGSGVVLGGVVRTAAETTQISDVRLEECDESRRGTRERGVMR